MYVLSQTRVTSPLYRNVEVPPSLKKLCTSNNPSREVKNNPLAESLSRDVNFQKEPYLVDRVLGCTAADGCKPPETHKPALQDLLQNRNGHWLENPPTPTRRPTN